MARKKFEDEHDNPERWLVSYADFITLLFAFFVVMYAISSVNEGKYRVLSESLGSAFGRANVPSMSTPTTPEPLGFSGRPRSLSLRQRSEMRREKEQMTGLARDLLKVLAPLVSQGKVRVTQTGRGVSIEINASVLFAPGEARLTPESSQALRAVAQVLAGDTHAIQVEGHTDNVPINNIFFPSNWELSAVRASSVVRLLMDSGIAEGRLLAVGHGSNQPVGSNDTVEGRLRNRRVEVMILSGLQEPVTELPVSAAP